MNSCFLLCNNQQIYTSWGRKNKNAYKAGGFIMKQIITLDNGTQIEIEGNEVKHIAANGSILYATGKVKDVSELPYFFLIGEVERKKVAEWFNEVNFKVDDDRISQRDFLERVKRALYIIDYDYYIATLEPSFDKFENIFYEEGNPVARGIVLTRWKEKASEFCFKNGWHSELAKLEEGDLFKAYRIAMGYWTIEYVCDDSSSKGNYWNSPNSARKLESSGSREVGGFKDGIGNTFEIYQAESGFALVGGNYNSTGTYFPVAYARYLNKLNHVNINGLGVLVIKRNNV